MTFTAIACYYGLGAFVTFCLISLYLIVREDRMLHDDARLMFYSIILWPIAILVITTWLIMDLTLYGIRLIRHKLGKDC